VRTKKHHDQCKNNKISGALFARPGCTRWFKYDRDYLCVNKSQFVPVIFEQPCMWDNNVIINIQETEWKARTDVICLKTGKCDGLL
jgi:hypothetical protein